MADLKPCPFCGGKAAFVPRAVNIVLQKDPSDPKFGVSVICGGCGSESPNMVDEAHAADAWNRRVTDGAAPCAGSCCDCGKGCTTDDVIASDETRPSLTQQLQQKCSDWGTYWRASDAHGVELTQEQALELLRDALGVEVEIKAASGLMLDDGAQRNG